MRRTSDYAALAISPAAVLLSLGMIYYWWGTNRLINDAMTLSFFTPFFIQEGLVITVAITFFYPFANFIQIPQTSALLLLTGIIFLIIGLVPYVGLHYRERKAERLRMRAKLEEIRTKRPGREPIAAREEAKKDVVYIRCKYCGAKVLATERKCPNYGAKL